MNDYIHDFTELVSILEKRIQQNSKFGYKVINMTLSKKDLNNKDLMTDIEKYFKVSGCGFIKTDTSVIVTLR
jgi:hypothetical protein